MPNYINIISQEEITHGNSAPAIAVGCILIAVVITSAIISRVKHKPNIANNTMFYAGTIGIVCMLVAELLSCVFLKVPTGKYRYEATIDKSKITVEEYEVFLEQHNPTVIDGVYIWEE